MSATVELIEPPVTTSRSIADELLENGYGYVKFALEEKLIEGIMRGWNKFLALPFEERLKWRVGDPRDYDDGYIPRGKRPAIQGEAPPCDGGLYDNKHFFHFRPHLTELLRKAGTNCIAHQMWFTQLNVAWNMCYHHFYNVVSDLDRKMPDYGFAERFTSDEAKQLHVLRLLSYNEKQEPNQELAKRHSDRNFGTFQVYESHPALVLHLKTGDLRYVRRPDRTLCFTSAKAAQLTGNQLPAIPHSIVAPPDVRPTAEPRQSIVFFAHIWPDTPLE